MPMYIGDYLRDTRHLSTLEHGAYFLLIMDAWTHGGLLPADEKRLARIAGMTAKEWAGSRDALLDFFDLSADGYRHGRVDEELAKTNALNSQRSEAGKASAAKRWGWEPGNETDNETVTGVITDPSVSLSRNDAPSPSTSQSDDKSSSNNSSRKRLAVKPEGVDDAVWADFQKLRKAKKAPLTETALKGIAREAAKVPGYTLNDALAECCERGWQGFKAEWLKQGRNGNGNGSRPSGWLS